MLIIYCATHLHWTIRSQFNGLYRLNRYLKSVYCEYFCVFTALEDQKTRNQLVMQPTIKPTFYPFLIKHSQVRNSFSNWVVNGLGNTLYVGSIWENLSDSKSTQAVYIKPKPICMTSQYMTETKLLQVFTVSNTDSQMVFDASAFWTRRISTIGTTP